MNESLKKFAPYVEKRLIRQVISPCGKLILWNYTDHCTYERAWDEVTLNARGTVYEISSGKVIARAFPKFFNFGENSPEKQKEIALKSKEKDLNLSAMFAILDGKDDVLDKIIMKSIRPVGNILK